MYTVKIRSSLSAGWKAFTKRPWYLIGTSLAFTMLFAFSLGNAAITALAYIVYGGYLALLLKHFRGDVVKFDDIFSLDSRWISFAFVGLIKTMLILVGFLCFIVPGIYLTIRWMFAEMLVIDKGMKPMEALQASSKLVEGHYWKLLLYIFVGMLVLMAGLILLVVGVIPASIILTFALIAVYENLKGVLDVPQAPTQPTNAGEVVATN